MIILHPTDIMTLVLAKGPKSGALLHMQCALLGVANPLKLGKAESGCGQSSKGGQGGEWVWPIL